jgi:hypothetical protein
VIAHLPVAIRCALPEERAFHLAGALHLP